MDFLLHDIVHQRDSLFLHKQLREIISGYTQLIRQLYNGNLLTKPLSHFFLASGYNHDLLKWLPDNYEWIEEVGEQGLLEGCKGDLMKMTQMAQYECFSQDMYDHLEDIAKYAALEGLKDAGVYALSDEVFDEVFFDSGIEFNDNNQRVEALVDEVKGAIQEHIKAAVADAIGDEDMAEDIMDEYDAVGNEHNVFDKLHAARCLMQFADFVGIPFDREWLHLDPEQARALAYAIRDDVPIDALEGYASGKYPAHLMEAIRMALNEGAEQQDIARLLNPALSEEQAWNFCSAICSGRFSPEQLDVLCDPSKPADYIQAMRSGFVYGLDTTTVLRYADGRFSPEQMDAIYIAAGDESLTPEMLDVIADPSLDPDSMTALKVSFQQGATIADVQHEKQGMQGSIKEDAVKSGTLHDVARESRDASARLGSDNRESKAAEREELE